MCDSRRVDVTFTLSSTHRARAIAMSRDARATIAALTLTLARVVALAFIVPESAREALERRIELSSATDSVRRAREAAYAVRALGVSSAYDGSAYHGHPAFVYVGGTESGGVAWRAACAVAFDCVAVAFVMAMVRSRAMKDAAEESDKVRFAAVMHLGNPLGWLSAFAGSTSAAARAGVYASAWAATSERDVASGCALALAAQVNPHVIAIAPVLLATSIRGRAMIGGMKFVGGFTSTALASFVAMGDDFLPWWRAAVTFAVHSEDQTPNLGLHWYVFTTIYDQFRLVYVVGFFVVPFGLSLAATIRFPDQPLVALVIALISIATCAPYPTVGDIVTYTSLLPVIAADDRGNPLVYFKHGAWIVAGFLYVALLSPLTWYMWIHTRVANANFYFAITIVHALAQTILSNQIIMSVSKFSRSRRADAKQD